MKNQWKMSAIKLGFLISVFHIAIVASNSIEHKDKYCKHHHPKAKDVRFAKL